MGREGASLSTMSIHLESMLKKQMSKRTVYLTLISKVEYREPFYIVTVIRVWSRSQGKGIKDEPGGCITQESLEPQRLSLHGLLCGAVVIMKQHPGLMLKSK